MDDLSEQIEAGYARDQQDLRPLVRRDQIPVSYAAITDAWLSDVLCRGVAGAYVVSHYLGEADDGTNNRRRIHLVYNAAGAAAGLPRSVFCKATHGLRNRLILGHSGAVLGEVTFYNHARNLIAIEAPRALHAAYDPVGFNSIVMLEDLGEDTSFCSEATRMDAVQVRSQLALLATLHGRFMQAPELDGALAILPLWHERFGNLERFHMADCCARGMAVSEQLVPAGLFSRREQIWSATLASIALHRDLPATLCHGDTHLKNWYRLPSGTMGLADWGVVHRGHWARDLAYTITTALEPEDRRQWERDLIAFYLNRLAQTGAATPSAADAWNFYREALLSVLAFWTMTIAPSSEMPDMQPPRTSRIFVGRIAAAIDDTGALDHVISRAGLNGR